VYDAVTGAAVDVVYGVVTGAAVEPADAGQNVVVIVMMSVVTLPIGQLVTTGGHDVMV
jgi:hypothetical protein